MLHDRSVGLLSRLPLFAGWEPASLEAVVAMNARYVHAPGEPLLRAGQTCSGALLIVDGTAVQLNGEEESEAEFGPGSLLAEMAMFVAVESKTTIVADSRVETICISRDSMREILGVAPRLARSFAAVVQGRLTGMAEQLREVEALLARTQAFNRGEDQNQPEPERDPTGAPSPAPHQQPASHDASAPEPALPRHGPDVAPGSTGASPVHGNSTT